MASLGFFNLKVHLGHPFTLEVQAGESDTQAETPTDWYTSTATRRIEILEEVLLKLAAALRDDAEAIELRVEGKEIVRDTSFPLFPPAHEVRAVADEVRRSLNALERVISGRTSPGEPEQVVVTRTSVKISEEVTTPIRSRQVSGEVTTPKKSRQKKDRS